MTIDGVPVPDQELSQEFHRLMQGQQNRPESLRVGEEELRGIAERNVVSRLLLTREARKRFPTVKIDEIKKRTKRLREQYGEQFDPANRLKEIEDDVRVQKLMKDIAAGAPKVSQDEARREYEESPEEYAVPEQVHVSHIVRHTFGGADPGRALQQIMDAQRLLKQGHPFEQVAQRFSDQHGQAGDLGTFPRGSMVDAFENVVFRMKSGAMSDVFQTEFGYHIALVHERIPAKPRSFEQARGDVTQRLRRRREQEALDEFVETLRSKATIVPTPSDTQQ